MNKIELIVSSEYEGERIDKFLALTQPELSRSYIQKLIDDGKVSVNNKLISKCVKVKSGDCISLDVPEPQELELSPQDIPLDIIYEDEHLLVVNKPKGMVVHPAAGNPDGTLVNALLHHCKGRLSSINGVIRPGIVHRIDKDTSGLLIVAKTDSAHNGLAKQIKEHSFKRIYDAVVIGRLKNTSGTINVPIGRSPKDRKKRAVNGLNPKPAITLYNVVNYYEGYTHVRFELKTGRTHQIRVHAAYIGHPVAGDTVYGPSKSKLPFLNGQCLNATVIGFVHPITGEYLEFDSGLPVYFTGFLNRLTPSEI